MLDDSKNKMLDIDRSTLISDMVIGSMAVGGVGGGLLLAIIGVIKKALAK